ncbi:zinc-binding dehydrogenase [Desulfosporosinus sp. BICA1-9]|uniref:zinc-dependent alcohol dehydrogenase n=1 Tax=Desulfosporosinus sp. BICA1-9 TaxID=1531958 RepID=UPI00054C49BE|nr:alcohol dehydrogenase catalytic domain-containing protein [Desulfosporosinus sp. BICA1-9]KJS50573.1 MAG: hypothetical protein VR66_02145 [Peptococcaceae bacterium BRH_c23]KJS82840.1 MAG: hypothetical protein JL57_23790 [Desulfosporosinus sp. BICA1-9]
MKAVRIHGPLQASIDELPIIQPRPDEVLVRVKAAGLCGTDYELYTNDMVYIQEGLSKLPMVPGHEWSGVVERVGAAVGKFKAGDKVTGECTVSCGKCEYCAKGIPSQCINRTETGVMNRQGGFAEYITFPEQHLHKFNTLSFEEAALIEPTAVALNAVMKGKVCPLDNVLVVGPGPLGLQAAQIAKKIFGAKRVILTGTRQERLDRANSYGLDGLINIRTQDIEDRVRELTDGEMIDVVIEESGGAGVFEDIKRVIRPCGRVVLNGFFGSKQVSIDWDFFTINDIEIIGALGSPNIWDDVITMLETGKIETKSLISHIFKLDEFEKGLDIMLSRKENVCKIILTP